MHYIGELTTDGYGMAIIPIDLLTKYLASKKMQGKEAFKLSAKELRAFSGACRKRQACPILSYQFF